MPVYDGVGGVVRKRKEWPVGIDGVVRQQKEHWAGIDGVKRRIFNSSKPLSSFSVGDIVNINQTIGGSLKAFPYIIVHKGLPQYYDASCNGIWLMSQYLTNDFMRYVGGINTFLSNTVYPNITASTRARIKQVNIKTSSVSTQTLYLFAPTITELGTTYTKVSGYGSKLDYFIRGDTTQAFNLRKAGQFPGESKQWALQYWTRNKTTDTFPNDVYIDSAGKVKDTGESIRMFIRYMMILDENAPVSGNTLV